MGGKGDLVKVFSDWPNWSKPAYFDVFYIASAGYHIESMVSHLLSQRNSDYVEMILHHVVTLNLIYFSYTACFTKIGILILFLHNWSDVFASGARAFGYIWSPVPAFFCIGLVASWYYSRIYCFSYIIYEVYVTDIQVEGIDPLIHMIVHNMFKFLLSCLMVLHIYWGIKITALTYGVFTKGKYEDNVHAKVQISSQQVKS